VAEPAGEDRGNHALAGRNRWRLVDGADARAQVAQFAGRRLPGVDAEDLQASLTGPQGTAEQPREAGLAGARRTDHRHPLAARKTQRDSLQRAKTIAVRQSDAGQFACHVLASSFPCRCDACGSRTLT